MDSKNETGRRIRELRLRRGMTLEELGQKCGATRSMIHKYETGETQNIKKDRLLKIAHALDVTPGYLIPGEDDKDDGTASSRLKDLQDRQKVQELAEKLHKDPELRMLFDLADGADPEDLQMVAGMLRRFKENR